MRSDIIETAPAGPEVFWQLWFMTSRVQAHPKILEKHVDTSPVSRKLGSDSEISSLILGLSFDSGLSRDLGAVGPLSPATLVSCCSVTYSMN